MKEIFQTVTAQLTDQLKKIESGEAEAQWFKPWTTSGMPQFPVNEVTHKAYKGMNALLLHMMALGNGYRTNNWMTFKQKEKFNSEHEAEARIRKGEHGFPIFKYVEWVPRGFKAGANNQYYNVKTGSIHSKDEVTKLAMRQYTVFNVDQMDGLPDGTIPKDSEPDWEIRYLAANTFIERLTCPMQHSGIDRAYYSPSKHFIRLPLRKTFKGEGEYLATVFHEHVHSTGKELERDMTGDMGTDRYAKEELVAEIGSAILCAQYGIAAPIQHPEYIHGYIKQLQDHDRAFWQAASKAQRAVEVLMNQSTEHRQEK